MMMEEEDRKELFEVTKNSLSRLRKKLEKVSRDKELLLKEEKKIYNKIYKIIPFHIPLVLGSIFSHSDYCNFNSFFVKNKKRIKGLFFLSHFPFGVFYLFNFYKLFQIEDYLSNLLNEECQIQKKLQNLLKKYIQINKVIHS